MIEEGKCFFGAGQCAESIAAMEKTMPANRRPILLAFYETLGPEGFYANPEILEAHNLFPGAYLQIGLELPTHNAERLGRLGDGSADELLRRLARRYQNIGTHVYLRIGYEFDGEWNGYEPEPYIAAFRRIVTVFRECGVKNVEMVWNTYICDNKEMYRWYPGDAYVDWFSFNTVTAKFSADWFMAEAREHGKPVMVGEASYAILDASSKAGNYTFENWCGDFFQMLDRERIQGFQYINWEWKVYPAFMNWSSWEDGRFSGYPERIAVMNRCAENERFIFRRPDAPSPIEMLIDCARGITEAQDGMAWSASCDHAALYPGSSYRVENAVCSYGNGWHPCWQGQNGSLTVELTAAGMKGDGFVILNFTAGFHQPVKRYTITLQGLVYELSYEVGGFCKIPVEIRPGEPVRLEIDSENGPLVSHIGLLSIDSRALPPPDGEMELKNGSGVLNWPPIQDAHCYHIYKNYQLAALTEENNFLLPSVTEKDFICVSAFHPNKGEGKIKAIGKGY